MIKAFEGNCVPDTHSTISGRAEKPLSVFAQGQGEDAAEMALEIGLELKVFEIPDLRSVSEGCKGTDMSIQGRRADSFRAGLTPRSRHLDKVSLRLSVRGCLSHGPPGLR